MSTAELVCDACGKPAAQNKSLLQCTRCKQAHYHDRKCQQQHYPKHKAMCRRVAATAKDADIGAGADAPTTRKSLVECRSVPGRGRSLVATAPLPDRCHPLTTRGDGLCEPIAHPVLITEMRGSRCSYCFQQLNNPQSASASSVGRLHVHCSQTCQILDKNWKAEAYATQKLPSPPAPTVLYCSRVIRKFKESPGATAEYDQLCFDIASLSEEERESYLSIMSQCHAFLVAMEDRDCAKAAHDMIHPDATPAYKFMSRLSMNGFTISNSEQLPIGFGVYCGASMINHSCRPNAAPTFWLRASSPPMLQITTCKSVAVGEEVTINYCDVTTPACARKKSLMENYKFDCSCLLCGDNKRDDMVVGLRCTTQGCNGRVRRSAEGSAVSKEGKQAYCCDVCQSTDFDDALKALSDSAEKSKKIESLINSMTANNSHMVGEECWHVCEELKRYCRRQTSYYLASSADLFVHWCANALKFVNKEREQLDLCHRALVVLNESRQGMKFCFDYAGNVSWYIKRATEAKLRLFANPMDMEALEMLQGSRKELLAYYPPSDETITSLEESLAAYSFS